MSGFDLGDTRWWLPEGVAQAEAEPKISAALAALADGARNLKRGRRKALYRLDLSGAGQTDFLLKVNHYEGRRRRRAKARHELALAQGVARRGIATPVPLAAGERREDGRLASCYLLVAIVPGVMDLREYMAASGTTPAARRALATAFGRFARSLHDAGIHQDDFQPNNFLVRPRPGKQPEFWVIDFERARLRFRVPQRKRRRALAKLEREAHATPATQRLRFLRAYASEGRNGAEEARRWWARITAEAPALARFDAARLRRNATRPGRRFATVRFGGAVGLAQNGLPLERLEGALAAAVEPRSANDETRAGARDIRPVGSHDDWTLTLSETGVAAARTALAKALVLAARGVSPTPLAVLCGKQRNILVLSRAELSVRASEVRDNATVAAARRVLERRLDAYGQRREPIHNSEVSLLSTGGAGVRAQLLGIEAWDVRRRFGGPGGSAG